MSYRRNVVAAALLLVTATLVVPASANAQYRTETVNKADSPHFADLDTITTRSGSRELGGMDGKAAGTRMSPVAMAVPAVLFGAIATAIPAIAVVGLGFSGMLMVKPNFGDTYHADGRPARENEYWGQYYRSRAKSRGVRALAAGAIGTAVGTGIYLARH